MNAYVQPVGRHLLFRSRLIVRDEYGTWYVWHAEEARRFPEAIDDGTAHWFLRQPWIEVMPENCAWVHVEDLPVVPDPSVPETKG